MNYRNGFQTVPICEGFIKDLELYDTRLYVWQDMDGYYHLAYNEFKKPICEEEAKKDTVKRIMTDDGEIREPDNRDIYALMKNDKRFTSMDEVFDRMATARARKKKYEREQIEGNIREEMHGVLLAGKQHKR